MAEDGSMLAVSLLASILFLGGWNGPIPIASLIGLTSENGAVAGYFGNVLGMLNVLAKGFLGVTVMMWVRWTLPRLRIDQVMTTCLKYCVPIAAVMFVGATAWQFQWPGRVFFGLVSAPQASFQLRENWMEVEVNPTLEETAPESAAEKTADNRPAKLTR